MKVQAPLEFPVYVLTARLENGLHWTEGLFFPEVARLGRGSSAEALLGSLKKRLERMDPLQMTQRQRPARIKLKRFRVRVAPPKKSAGPWKEPYQLEVDAVIYRLSLGGKQLWAAHLPQFQLEVTVEQPQELEEAVAREVRSLLVRDKLLSKPGDLILMQRWQSLSGRFTRIPVKGLDPAKEKAEAKQLIRLTSPLTQDGSPRAVLVEAELAQLADLLAEHNVLLVGPSGCGKSALVHELARRRDDFQLGATSFFETSGARLMLGEVSFGGWQQRCQKLIEELARVKGILHLGGLQELLESARHSTNPYGLAGFLRPYLGGKKLQGLAEATPEQLAVVEREYPQLLETFIIMRLEPTTPERTLAVLGRLYPRQAPQCLQAVAELHERFTSASAAPGWPVRFMRGLLRQHRRPERAEVMQHFSRQSGLPLLFLEDSQPFLRSQVRDWFGRRLHGQDQAVERAVDRLAAFKHGLTRPNRPVASFLLIGPTGVGKTELARCLAEFVFQDRDRLTRLDMSEYSTPWAVKRLIGGESGLLVAKVRERPFQVLLFDEVEKAHPDFFDLLLQVLGDARLSDERGEVADFSNCLILMTSNLGAENFHKGSLGLREQSNEGQFMPAVRAAFRPELLNRIDEIIPFQTLSRESVLRICQWELQRLGLRQGMRGRPLEVKIGPGVAELLAEQGYHRLYGARPLKRALDRLLLAPLAQQLNAHPAQVALKIHIDRNSSGGGLLVRAYPQSTVEKANAQQEQQRECNHAVSQLRRRYRRLEKGPVVTELRNEKVRHEHKFKTAWPPAHFLEHLDGLGPRVNDLEELALGALSDPQLFDVLPQRVKALDLEVEAALRQAYCLVQPQPHQLLLALYSESSICLEYLAKLYLETLQARGYGVKLESLSLRKGAPPNLKGVLPERLSQHHEQRPFTLTEQGWSWHPQLDRHLIEPAALGRHKALGYLLEVSGKFCAPWLRGEGGLQKLQHKGREDSVLVEVSSDPRVSGDNHNPYVPPAYQPPPDVHRKGTLQHPIQVRNWNLDEGFCHDPVGGRLYLHPEILDKLLEKRLLRRAAEAALLP
ncbi:MAG: AAA family ATPase [Candidatus Eremiobacteraeota bacterium]|nr:AAA family ATPase [Candidatus Eremiobacteraeota bacterium]MCW5869586.1 AAA family ATPase [Candidatus Eremiobacteraeota bacterium]